MPAALRVFERGWLSCNNILLIDRTHTTLVDSGYWSHRQQTVDLVEHALGGQPLEWLVNTHCHSDHMGGNAALQQRYACRTTVPVGEAPLIRRWDERELMLGYADQHAERFAVSDALAAGDTVRMGGIDWQVVGAPGHDPHAVMFHSPQERLLISGDALWESGFGVIFPALFGDNDAFGLTRQTLDRIASLGVRTVIPGHGRVFTEVEAALERAYFRLESYEQDVTRLARHAAKVMVVFALMDQRDIALAELPQYVERIGIMRDVNARFLKLSPAEFAQWLAGDLVRAGAVIAVDGKLKPR